MAKDKIKEFYLNTSMFTDLGKYKQEAIDLYVNKCDKSLKKLCNHLMNVTIHRVLFQWALEGRDVHEYGDFSYVDYTTPMSEDDIFVTASSMFAEIFRRDKKGFYIGRPVQNRLNVTCRYVSVLTCAILKANGIPCRSRAGWARYLDENKSLDHFVNEYYDENQKRWVMIDMDDLYDEDWLKDPLFKKNNICNEYLDFGKNQFYTAADAWKMYRKDAGFVSKLIYGADEATAEDILKYLFLDFFAVMNMEYNYTFKPIALDKPINALTKAELKEIDTLAELMSDIDKNFDKIQKLYQTPRYRMLTSPLVGKGNFDLLIKNKGY